MNPAVRDSGGFGPAKVSLVSPRTISTIRRNADRRENNIRVHCKARFTVGRVVRTVRPLRPPTHGGEYRSARIERADLIRSRTAPYFSETLFSTTDPNQRRHLRRGRVNLQPHLIYNRPVFGRLWPGVRTDMGLDSDLRTG